MKALSLSRPWDYVVLHCGKDIENRRWSTNYRGRLLIHRARSWDEEGFQWLMRCGHLGPGDLAKIKEMGAVQHASRWAIIPTGIAGEAQLVDCISGPDVRCCSRWYFGPYGFVLEKVVAYDAMVPYRGKPGLFDVPICGVCGRPLSESRATGCPGELCDRCAVR